jgi:hypothetical protein
MLLFIFACHLCAASNADERLPVPSKESQRDANALVKDVYDDEIAAAKTTEQKTALVMKLIALAAQPSNDAPGRFALYRAALNVTPNATVAMAIIDDMAELFKFDRIKVKASTLLRLSKSVKVPSEQQVLATASMELITSCVARDDFASATKLAELAHAAAEKSRNTVTIRAARATSEKIVKLRTHFQTVQASLATLEIDPTDPEANEIAGRYRCFTKGQWGDGLPMLALSKDKKLRSLAAAELKQPTTSNEQVTLADGWHEYGESSSGDTKERSLQRARNWYQQALKMQPPLSALVRAKVEKRVAGAAPDVP